MGRIKQWKKEPFKKGRYHRKRDSGNLNGNSGSIKSLTMSLHMQYKFCTDCGMFQAEIIKMIGL